MGPEPLYLLNLWTDLLGYYPNENNYLIIQIGRRTTPVRKITVFIRKVRHLKPYYIIFNDLKEDFLFLDTNEDTGVSSVDLYSSVHRLSPSSLT